MTRLLRAAGLTALTLGLLLGCATGYYPMRPLSGYGYEETQVGENVFMVQFSANDTTRPQRAMDFAMLRAAELTRQHGYSFFVITDSSAGSEMVGSIWRDQTYLGEEPRVTLRFTTYREKPKDAREVLEARFVEQSIRQKYGL